MTNLGFLTRLRGVSLGLVLAVAPFGGAHRALAQGGATEGAPAPAQSPSRPGDEAVAAELFRQGRTALESGDYRAACPKLAESQRLSPRAGTLLNLARCHELEGKTASAWAEFGTALAQARRENRPDREAIAREHLDSLGARLSRLTVVVPPSSDVVGLEVRYDGTEFKRAIWGEALPVDPGSHLVEASAPGRLPFRVTVVVGAAGDRQSVRVPVLRAAPAVVGGAGKGSPEVASASDGARYRTLGWAALGVGAAGVGAAAVLGAIAMGERRRGDDRCEADGDPMRCLDARGVEANERAKSFADVATVSGALGVALAGVGAYLVLSHPRGGARGAKGGPSSALLVGPRGVSWGGSF